MSPRKDKRAGSSSGSDDSKPPRRADDAPADAAKTPRARPAPRRPAFSMPAPAKPDPSTGWVYRSDQPTGPPSVIPPGEPVSPVVASIATPSRVTVPPPARRTWGGALASSLDLLSLPFQVMFVAALAPTRWLPGAKRAK
jgi:hypothetical protein